MRKICSLVLAMVLLFGAVYVIPVTAAAADQKYYTNITFDEAYYENGAGTTYTEGMNITEQQYHGKVIQFTTVVAWAGSEYAQGFKFADNAGTADFVLKAGVTYNVSYDILSASNDNSYNKYIDMVVGDVQKYPSNANPGKYIHDARGAIWNWETKNFTITPTIDMDGFSITGTGTKYNQTIYIDNVVITTDVSITYNGGDAAGLPTTVQTGTTFEELLGDAVGNWYLDEAGTKAAEGTITEPVTLYAKKADNTCYYTHISFDEAYYTEGAGTTYTAGMNLVNNYNSEIWEDSVRGFSIQFTEIANWYTPTEKYAQGFKFADYAGTQDFVLKAGVTYNISYDIKSASSDNAFNKYINIVSGDVQSLPSNANPGEYKGDVKGALWNWETKTISITPAVDMNAFSISSGAIYTNQNILIDNVIISTTANISYVGGKISGLPATVQTGTTYEELLGETADTWYLDAEYTIPATGVITNIDVTLYAKHSQGVATPSVAGLFVPGESETAIEGEFNGAVYTVDGVQYTAFRVFGTYIAPDDGTGTAPDYSKVVAAVGDIRDIKSRHVMLGYGAAPTIDNYYAKTNSTNFEKCWSTKQNADGTWTVTYSLLLKDIPEQYKDTAFYVNSAIVVDGETIYADSLEGISAQAVYNAANDSSIGWF